jgi:hypothetical protein
MGQDGLFLIFYKIAELGKETCLPRAMKLNKIEDRIYILNKKKSHFWIHINRFFLKLILLTDFVKPVLLVPGPVDFREESQHVRTQGVALKTQNLKSQRYCEPIPHIYHIRASKPTVPGAAKVRITLSLKGKEVMTGKCTL